MSRKKLKDSESVEQHDVISLLEDAVHLLKISNGQCWLIYLAGVVPFLASFVIFWAEMANSGLAYRYLPVGALIVTISYLWMKCWQAYWMESVRNILVQDDRRSTLRHRLRIARRQIILQPWSLIAIPLGLVLIISYPWLFGFFQNLTVCEAIGESEEQTVTEKAMKNAGIQKMQLGLFSMLWLKLLIFFVFVNWLTVLAAIPYLMFTLLGIDSEFVRSPYALLTNSTFYITALAMTYLTLDPLVKAFFFLRCYYAESRTTGMDVLVMLKRMAKPATTALTLFVLFCTSLPQTSWAQTETDSEVIPLKEFEDTMQEVSSQKKYIWRHPTELIIQSEEPPGWAIAFREYTQEFFNSLEDLWDSITKWLRDLFKDKEPEAKDATEIADSFSSFMKVLLITLVVLLAVVVGIVFVRSLRKRRPTMDAAAVTPAATDTPDLNREDVTADELPIHRWLSYAQELAAKGDYRLAIRAVFLAQIAFLADKRLIVIARYKSNRDYARELARRAHAYPKSLESFRQSSRIFESIWYGDYASGPEQYKELESQFHQLEQQA